LQPWSAAIVTLASPESDEDQRPRQQHESGGGARGVRDPHPVEQRIAAQQREQQERHGEQAIAHHRQRREATPRSGLFALARRGDMTHGAPRSPKSSALK
jgi:hypothetical protein